MTAQQASGQNQESLARVEAVAPRPRRGRRRLAVLSRQSLVADAVRMSLSSRGFEGVLVRWSGDDPAPVRRLIDLHADCVLLMAELEEWPQLREVQEMIGLVPQRWLVLTATPRGPLWGAVLETGASAVLPTSTTLDEIVEVLALLAVDEPVMEEDERQVLLDAWIELQAEQELLAARMRSLTPREQTVLRLLYAGEGVRSIAERLEVSEGTVRSQVKSVLRKLDVNSQLAAVAALWGLHDDPSHGDPVVTRPRSR